MSVLILLFSFLNIIPFIGALASIKFKTFHPKTSNMQDSFSTKEFVQSIILSKMYLELIAGNETGENNYKTQILNIFPSSSIDFYIESYNYLGVSDEDKIFCNYSRGLSDTYKRINPDKKIAEESFKIFTDINLSNGKYVNIKFNEANIKFTEEELIEGNEYLCGLIGIDNSIFHESETNFMPQLVKILNSSDKILSIKYDNKTSDEGQIIIGDMPHNYLKNEYYENQLIDFKSGNDKWSLTLDSIILEGYNIESTDYYSDLEVSISFEHDGIIFPDIYYDHLKKIFFYKYYDTNICQNETIFASGKAYYIVSCDAENFGKNDIKKFPKIIFTRYRANLNFSFEGEELFYYKDNRYYLKIFKTSIVGETFEFGRNFLKKYLTVFNFDIGAKQIFFYKKEEKKDDEDENNLWKILLIAFLAVILIFLFLGIFIGKKIYQARKKRANELEDDYLYDSNRNEENGKEKLFNEEKNE